MPDRSLTSAPACRVGVWGRLARGAVAVVTAAFAASMLPTDPVTAAVAGLFAVLVAVMAITGWCPADWLAPRRQSHAPQNTLGFPDAHQDVDLAASIAAVQNRSSHVHE
ncbi:DUF2892 domain-containing protein [Microbacterium profundi]|uniref:YgaP-like transmembrane domain n=1 Tax=Microbacterium TaxID=33882 RepID=UPI000AD25903|nr:MULTISPECIES: YgaP-like transmembrane domain [Microbacterium]MCE7483410.1 DUF2892 domain-containing protein [Microbacterium profundi]